ncbi:hypothetical protein AXG93_4520s1060 [Marchantia polymorpha subsp. ruderalis]|uniref:Uncharacterized protein n=1 Tax=Marchantia polymorpha subsp. ruderalis TaxID=1480154 RepID=A0A176VTF5_MARPO|nr:hypothetical protein AXG93_4520s1060 [Marchantia polymorpha subsp. ruderalis]
MTESSDSSVEKTVAAAIATAEDTIDEPTLEVMEEGPSAVSIEVLKDVAVEPSEERSETASLSFLSSEQMRSMRNKDIPQPKTSEELVKELTKSEAILEQIVAQLKTAVAVKREWDSETKMAKKRAASLTIECAATKPTLQEQEDRFRAKEMECEVLRLNLVKESDRCAELEQAYISLRATNENVQKVTADLCARLETSKEAYEAVVQRAKRLIATTGKREHVEED